MTTPPDVLDWLLDSDPAIRWQVLRDLADAPDEIVTAERGRVATHGWGARLLALRGADGQWAGGALFPAPNDKAEGIDSPDPLEQVESEPEKPEPEKPEPQQEGLPDPLEFGTGPQPWTATGPTLDVLREFGIDPHHPKVRETIALVAKNCHWEHDGQAFFTGEVEACINGRTVALGAYFEQDVDGIVERLLRDQLADGGWNCWTEFGATRSSFASTIDVLEGLLAHERATGGTAATIDARQRGEEYLLERRLFRRRSNGHVVRPDWLEFSFPPRWHYDVLRALEHFRSVGGKPDPRLHEAIELVRSKRRSDGRWLLENTHPGEVYFALEDGDGQPSRWNTLRALRVLRWYESAS